MGHAQIFEKRFALNMIYTWSDTFDFLMKMKNGASIL